MVRNSIKKIHGTRKLKKLLNVYYEGEVLENLVSELYPLVDSVAYDGLGKIVGFCNQLAGDHSGRTAVTLLEESPELIDRLLMYGDKVLVLNVYGLCSQVAGYSEGPAVRLLAVSPELIDRAGYDGLEKVAKLCGRVAQADSFVATRLMGLSPELIDRVGYDGLEKVAALCTQVARDYNWRTAVRLLGMSPDIIERLLRYGDKELVLNVYGLCSQVAMYSVRAAVSLLEQSPDLLGRASYGGLEKVACKASEIAKVDGEEKAASFVRGESSEYADFFEAISEGLELKRVKPVLLHYLNALLGYRIEIVEAQGAATTDGERIFLPVRIKEFEDEDRNFILYKVMATHEEAHLEYGSFDFELMRVRDVVSRIEGKYERVL